MHILGIDVGGSGIKGAPVDTVTGKLVGERMRLRTPQPPTPESVAAMVAELVAHFEWTGRVGVGFPAVVRGGVVHTAANIDPSWIGVDAQRLFADHAPCSFHVVNDADAAGLAEMKFGAGRGREGVVLLLTIGTGIGSALFVDGRLVPNTEFGHLEVRGRKAEHIASGKVRQTKRLSWKKWSRRLRIVLQHYEDIVWPDRIVIGGGVSKKADKFIPLLDVRTEVVPASMRNLAGIVGAAMFASEAHVNGGERSITSRLKVWSNS